MSRAFLSNVPFPFQFFQSIPLFQQIEEEEEEEEEEEISALMMTNITIMIVMIVHVISYSFFFRCFIFFEIVAGYSDTMILGHSRDVVWKTIAKQIYVDLKCS